MHIERERQMRYRQKAYIVLVMMLGVSALGLCAVKMLEADGTTGNIGSIVNWLIMLVLIVLCRAL